MHEHCKFKYIQFRITMGFSGGSGTQTKIHIANHVHCHHKLIWTNLFISNNLCQSCILFSGKRSMRLSSLRAIFFVFVFYLLECCSSFFFLSRAFNFQDVYFWRIEYNFGKTYYKLWHLYQLPNATKTELTKKKKNIMISTDMAYFMLVHTHTHFI